MKMYQWAKDDVRFLGLSFGQLVFPTEGVGGFSMECPTLDYRSISEMVLDSHSVVLIRNSAQITYCNITDR